MDKLKMHSPDMTQQNIEKIQALFPNCVTESKGANGELKLAIDFDQLKQELSNSIVEGPQERYQLNWPGKRKSMLKANSPITKTLRPNTSESVSYENTQNLFIEGNNLTALKLIEEMYLGKIKLIYIDPPYNTGGDLLYNDDFSLSSAEFFKEDLQIDDEGNKLTSNLQGNGKFHTKWLNMIYPRLIKAKNLLSDDGFLAISIDDNELSNLLSIVDELFGWENRKVICVKMSEPTGVKMASINKNGGVAKLKEYVVLVGKSGIKGLNLEKVPKGSWDNEYKTACKGLKKDELEFIKKVLEDEQRTEEDIIEAEKLSQKLSFLPVKDLCMSEGNKKLSEKWLFENAWRIVQFATLTGGAKDLAVNKKLAYEVVPSAFVVTTAQSKAYLVRGDFNHETRLPRCKMLFADKYLEVHPGDFWSDIKTTGLDNEGGVDFKNGKKPLKLIKRLIKMATKDDDTILDFFAGSGTTGQATWEANIEDGNRRKFILVQYPELFNKKNEDHKESITFCELNGLQPNVAELSKHRLRINIEKLKEQPEIDLGFRVLKVDSSNMTDVYYSPDQVTQGSLDLLVDNIKADRTDEDLLFQVLLDWGVDLTLPIRKETIQGKTVFFVDDDALVACFDLRINEALIKELAIKEPLRVVFRDDGFESDAVKINAEQIFKQVSPHTEVKAI